MILLSIFLVLLILKLTGALVISYFLVFLPLIIKAVMFAVAMGGLLYLGYQDFKSKQ